MVTYTRTGCSNSPGGTRSHNFLKYFGSCLTLLLLTFAFSVKLSAQFATVDFHQAENDKQGAKTYDINWVNGILNATHTDYFEGIGVPQRIVFTGIQSKPGNQHSMTFQYLAEKGGKHAYDFPISWDQAVTTAGRIGNGTTNELQKLWDQKCYDAFSAQGKAACDALSLVTGLKVSTPSFPDNIGDPTGTTFGNVNSKISAFEATAVYGNRTLELRGDQDITAASIDFLGYQGSGQNLATYRVSWTSASSMIMMRLAGRLSSGAGEFGYGEGMGAGSVSGGPYHFKLMDLDGFSVGSQDNQIMSNAVQIPPVCSISPAQFACPETAQLTFNYTGGTAGATFQWSINAGNTAGAQISGSSTSSSVVIVPIGTDFVPGGTFDLTLAVTSSGGTTTCTLSPAGTIENVVVSATANPTTFPITAASPTSQLTASVMVNGAPASTSDFTFSWTQDPPTGGSLSATNIYNPVFTATQAGTYDFIVTATQKAAPNCSAKDTVTVVVTPGPTCPEISGPQTVCPSSTGLTYSAAGSIPVNTTYTWSIASGDATIVGNNVNVTSITVNAGTSDFVVRLTMTFANTSLAPVQCNYNVTVNNINPGSIDNAQTICSGADPAALSSTTAATGDGAITYQWQSNTTGCNGTFTNISGATDATYDPGPLTVTTYYRRVATSTLNGVACSANSNCVAITVNDITPGTINNAQTICSGADPAALTVTTAATGSGALTYQWQSNTTGCNGTFTNISGATDATYDPGPLTVTTYYRRVATSTLNGVACSANSNCVAITVNDITPGSITGNQNICAGTDAEAFTSVAATGSGAITYQWQSNTTGCNGTFTNISGATDATYDPGVLTVTTYYRRVATSTLNGVACSANSNCLTVTVNNNNAGSIDNAQTICSGADPAALTSVAPATGTGTITYQWQSNTAGCNGTFTDISGATGETYDPGALTVTTYYRRVATSTVSSNACPAISNCVAITVNDITPGSINNAQTICSGDDPAALTSVTAATGSGAITYQWQSNTTGCNGTFTNISGATDATYDPGPLTVTTYYRRVATSTLNGVACSANSNCVAITVNDITPGTINNAQTICSGADPAALTVTTAATGSGALTYQWQSNTTGCNGTFTNISGATDATYDPGPLTVTTYYRRVATSTLNGVACSANSNCVAITVNDVTPGTINNAQTICSGADPAALSSVTAATGSGAITYQWQSNTTGCNGTFTNISGATGATYDPGPLTITTYYRRVATSTLNGVACSANSNCVTITVNPCAQTLCTYTQGAYGNYGGKYCTAGGQKTTVELINYSLANWGGQLYLGKPGQSFTITPSQVDALIGILPGGGASTALPAGNWTPSTYPILKNGKLTNTLLAQTITLGLNLGVIPGANGLGNAVLESGENLVTAKPAAGCDVTSSDIVPCTYKGTKLVSSAVIQFLYNNMWNGSGFVADGSSDKKATIMELFQLASSALGGTAYGQSLGAIASLEDQINNVFDGCRVNLGYMTDTELYDLQVANGCFLTTASVASTETSDLKLAAYPNPYNNTVSFNFTSPVSGKALLEVYDMVGRRLAVVFEGNVDAGIQRNVNYRVPSAQRVPMIYKLSIGGKTSFGKLLPGTTD